MKLIEEIGLAERAKQVPVLNKNGGDRKSDQCDNSKNITLIDRGTSSDYRISKLKRDHPEVALMLEQGSSLSW